MRYWSYAILALSLIHLCLPAYAWDWKLPTEQYQEMDVFARDQYQKAEKAFDAKNYRLAATEFERFSLEFPDSPSVAAAMFMKGYSLQLDLKRNEARKEFENVVSFLSYDRNYAGAAAYQIGRGHIDNGEILLGLRAYQRMVAKDGFPEHPLAALALKDLAENALKNDEPAKYERYMKQAYQDFWTTNRTDSNNARILLTRFYVKGAKWKALESAATTAYGDEPTKNQHYWWDLWHRAHHEVLPSADWYTPKEAEQKQKDIDAFWAYWKTAEPMLREQNLWAYQSRSIEFLLRHKREDRALWEPMVAEFGPETKNDDIIRHIVYQLYAYEFYDEARALGAHAQDQNAFFDWYVPHLLNRHKFDEAENAIGKITDPGARSWRIYELRWRQGKVQECIDLLTEIAANDTNRANAARYQLGYIYRDHTKQYDKAIEQYTAIAEQPRCDFEIAICYDRSGRQQKAAEIYTGIENFFPASGPEAAWRRAMMWAGFGDKDKAAGDCRRLIRNYGGTDQASKAHVWLEENGYDIGGGEVREQG